MELIDYFWLLITLHDECTMTTALLLVYVCACVCFSGLLHAGLHGAQILQ